MRLFIILFLFFAITALHAQPTTTPPFLLQYLQSGTDSLAILTKHKGEMVRVGTAIRETIITATTVTQVERLAIGEHAPIVADSCLLDRESLLPLASYKQGDHARELTFTGSTVRIIDADSTRTFLRSSSVFYANSIDLLVRSLPLQTGYSTTLPMFSENTGEQVTATITVIGKEKIRTLDGETCEAFIAEVQGSPVEGKFSIDVATRALIRYNGPYAHLLRIHGCSH